MVSGGVNVGKRYLSKPMPAEEAAPFMADAADAFTLIEDLITREKIDCGWTKAGYFLGAWCKSHYDDMAKKVTLLNANGEIRFLYRTARQAARGDRFGLLSRRLGGGAGGGSSSCPLL